MTRKASSSSVRRGDVSHAPAEVTAGTFCQRESGCLDAAGERWARAKERKDPQQVVVQDPSAVLVGEEVEGLEHRNEVIRRSLGDRIEDRGSRSRRLGTKDHLVHAVLLDRRCEEIGLIRAGVDEEIGRGVPNVVLALGIDDADRAAALLTGALAVLDEA